MGLLTLGIPLSWEDTKKESESVRQRGVKQFINHFKKFQSFQGNSEQWGDEIECILVKFDHRKKQVKALLKSDEILQNISENPDIVQECWAPEYANFMIEGVPANPYRGLMDCIKVVEGNFRKRRKEIQALLDKDEAVLTLGTFPLIGRPGFSFPEYTPNPETSVSESIFYPDEAIFLSHPHFPVVTRNIVQRRGEKPSINIPIFMDEETPKPFIDPLTGAVEPSQLDYANRKPNCIYMDSMPFGPSCCCLQMTFQTKSLAETLKLSDQLIPICPIILAVTAATPIFKGYLSDLDCRWQIIKAALDDRTEEERGLTPLLKDRFLITTSRCDSVDMYMLPEHGMYNDIGIPYCPEAYEEMILAGVPHLFAESMAHLFIRDPIQLFKDKVESDSDDGNVDFFESFHLFHWRTGRIKLPPISGESGWKFEFRPSEIQATDFQNAAVAVFVFLLTRLVLENKINLVMPITEVFKNMTISQSRDAVLNRKFFFRKSIVAENTENDFRSPHMRKDMTEMTANEVINGNPSRGIVGVADLIDDWLDESQEVDHSGKQEVRKFVNFVRQRASGKIKTVAKWMRDFVRNHGKYEFNSVVKDEIAYDMLLTMHQVAKGELKDVQLQGDYE